MLRDQYAFKPTGSTTADDTTLVVPEHTDVSIHDEFEHVRVWASVNKLLLNAVKTKEIVFKRPRALLYASSP